MIVVCRGGGAIEDLWCFNDEVVARAAFAASVPVVSGVGHETDTTLIDHVADHRAHTPTDAAQTVIPDRRALEDALQRSSAYLGDAVERALERREERLAPRAGAARSLRDPAVLLERRQAQTRELGRRLGGAVAARLERGASALERAGSRLERSGPFARVGRAEERLRALAAPRGRRRPRGGSTSGGARTRGRGPDRGRRRARAGRRGAVESARANPGGRVSPRRPRARLLHHPEGRRLGGGDAADLAPGERISTLLSSGEVDSEVTDTRPDPGAEERA